MSESSAEPTIHIKSARFGDLIVPESSVITLPVGLIGFPNATRFVMLDHKPPFSWLHSVEDTSLAFVVIDGFGFCQEYGMKAPIGDRDIDLQEADEFAVLVVVTVRPDPRMTTANIKAPIFVNIRNRKGVQIIFDDSKYPTRLPLWSEEDEEQAKGTEASAQPSGNAPKKS